MLEPTWVYKVRRSKGIYSSEKVVRIPPEVADQLGDYVRIRLSEGRLIIEPLENFNFKNFKGDEQG